MQIIQLTHEANNLSLIHQARLFLSEHLRNLYPGFDHWFNTKIAAGSDSLVLLAMEKRRVLGVSIGRTGIEPKLRCVRVHGHYQGTGLGLRLVDATLKHLQTEKPHCTVAQEMLHEYSRPFVKRYGFALSDVTKGEYRQNKLEYHWN